MSETSVICSLVERTHDDFVAYYANSPHAARAAQIVAWAFSDNSEFLSCEAELESLLPDTAADGSLAASYALDAGIVLVSLIDSKTKATHESYQEAVQVFFDTVDFRVQEAFVASGVTNPSDAQIAQHPLMLKEKAWFAGLLQRVTT